jgi:thiol:disulfide interchange protein DsbD
MCIRSLLGWWSIAIKLYLKNQGNFNLEGKAKESKTKTAYNDIFEVNETFFQGKPNTTDCSCNESQGFNNQVELNYQVCKEVCINLERNFFQYK